MKNQEGGGGNLPPACLGLKDLSKNILKQMVGKGKSCSGALKVPPPCPHENFNRTKVLFLGKCVIRLMNEK